MKEIFDEIKQLKVVIVGKAEVGKTTLVKRIFEKEIGWGNGLEVGLQGKWKEKQRMELKCMNGIPIHI